VITYALGHNPHTNAMIVGLAYDRSALPLNFTPLTTTTSTNHDVMTLDQRQCLNTADALWTLGEFFGGIVMDG